MSVPDILLPSPPTTNHRHRTSIPLPFKPAMSTPDDSPASFPPSSGNGTRKRVEFSPWHNVLDPLTSTPASAAAAIKALPPSRDCQTNGKSILKPFNEPAVSNSNLDGPNERTVVSSETLEMIAQQLMNNNKGSSVDAYQTISQMIKAYDEIPEDLNTRSCIATILRCIKRDLSIQDQIQSSPVDTNLMTQALKVSVILVWSEHLSPLLTDEFRVFIVDRSINALVEHTAPKVVIVHYMHLLAMQNFRHSIMSSNNRAVKLLEALQDISNHVPGKSAVSERLLIYQKLLEQARPIMKARVSLWIREVFHGFSSPVKDLRDKAISVSTRVCAAFPSASSISSAAKEALTSTITDRVGNTRTLNSILTQRLDKMVATKDEAVQVPQIWSLSMLLCNGTETRLESWTLLRDWLKVIQRCFNCSDASVKLQAFPAWNRFICVSKPHEASDIIVSMLAKPIITQIERTSSNTVSKSTRTAAVSSYCMLLFYAFRPAATHKQYTRMWNEYIVKFMGSQFLSRSTANADLCSRIITTLMFKEHSASRVWNENRAHENTLLDPEDLPATDCKWVRSKTQAILQMFRLLFKHSVWGPSVQPSDQAFVAKAWRHFLRAIRESTSKEIKPSADTKSAISHIVRFIQEISEAAYPPSKLSGQGQLACKIAVAEIGSKYFLEALEADTSLKSPAIIGELVKTALVDAAGHLDDGKAQFRGVLLDKRSSPQLQRSVKVLEETLRMAYEPDDPRSLDLNSMIMITSQVLKSASKNIVPSILKMLQPGLAMVLEDCKNLAKLGSDSSSFPVPWIDLSENVASKLMLLDVSLYEQFDDILAGMLSSRNLFTKNAVLKAWTGTTWQDKDVCYGPKLTQALILVRDNVEVDLPGVPALPDDLSTQVERSTHVDSVMEDMESEIESLEAVNDTSIDAKISGGEPPHSINKEVAVENEQLGTKIRSNHGRPRHDDSQVNFVPIDSTVQCSDDVESQLLTEKQKETRQRQRCEQVVTFPDLRSSPRPRSIRGSRAPSVDCEMTRKLAVADDLLTTPTITRQTDAMDEDELPSPTPKARNKSIGLIDVDIPSSPPSVSVNRKTNSGGLDILSSPPKPHVDNEVDMLNLDDDLPARKEIVDGPERGIEEQRAAATTMPVAEDHIHSSDATKATSESVESELGSAVLETAQENVTLKNTTITNARDMSPAVESDQDNEGDDIDELTASQLSQSLEIHIAEESRHPTASPDVVRPLQTLPKRRKRSTNGYADQDRKKRRRRTIVRDEASMSPLASDDFSMAHEELAEDCVVVNTPSTKSSRRQHRQGSAKVHDSPSASEPTSPEKLRSSGLSKHNDIPHHVKTLEVTPTKESARVEHSPYHRVNHQEVETGAQSSIEVAALSQTKDSHDGQVQSHGRIDVMTALQTALTGLQDMAQTQQGSLDLRMIDDLCFKIRFQAQEIEQGRKKH